MSDQLTATVPAESTPTPGTLETVPTTETPQFYCMLTNAGAALEAQAHAQGRPVRLTHVAVGDGNGTVPTPSVEAVALLREVYRKAIDSIERDASDPNIAWIHIVIPADDGGFWIREFGVWAEPLEEGGEPVLYAYGNHAPYYKLKHILGQATTHELSIPLIMSGTAEVEIVISEVGYASRLELLQLVDNVHRREVERMKEFIILSDRVTKLELAQGTGVPGECDCGCGEITEEIADFKEELAGMDLVKMYEQALA